MAIITAQEESGDRNLVVVKEAGGSSQHHVTVGPDQRADLSGAASAEELIEAPFEFLLEKEPKESILSEFELLVIARYFSDYPLAIRQRLSG